MLLTPYNGHNLGDAAIQYAVIANVRRRRPDAEIRMVTLRPEVTTALHGVRSFPITGFALPNYSSGGKASRRSGGKGPVAPDAPSFGDRVRMAAKHLPFEAALKRVYRGLAAVVRSPWSLLEEGLHLVRAMHFMRGVNLLLVSGGGQLDDYWGGAWGHPYALVKWGLLGRAVRARMVFLGVGTCVIESRLSRLFIHGALRLATSRSYRDQESKELLRRYRFTHQDAVCPDLAFSYVPDERLGSVDPPRDREVGVSPIAYLSRHGWPRQDVPVYERYLGVMVQFVAELVRRGSRIALFTTERLDWNTAAALADGLEKELGPALLERIRRAQVDTVDDLVRELSGVGHVVASRLHGVLLSQLLGIPVLAVSYDRKVDTHMADMGMRDYCMDIHAVAPEPLLAAFEGLVRDTDLVRARLKEQCARNAAALSSQYDLSLA